MGKFYVSMTDTFMSGWGKAKGKVNKLVLECDSMEEAMIVEQNARKRSDQKDIIIHTNKPVFSTTNMFVSFKTKLQYPVWYDQNQKNW
jgi:hypothetical protein